MKHQSAFNSDHRKFEPKTGSESPIHFAQELNTVDSQHCFTKTDDGQKEAINHVQSFPAPFRFVRGFIAIATHLFENDLEN
jgi:hypothetical protein